MAATMSFIMLSAGSVAYAGGVESNLEPKTTEQNNQDPCIIRKEAEPRKLKVRQGFSRDMADQLLGDISNAITDLEKLEYPTPTRIAQDRQQAVKGSVFTHTGCPKSTK